MLKTKLLHPANFLLMCLCAFGGFATAKQKQTLFFGIQHNDTISQTRQKLAEKCQSLQQIAVPQPSFPFSAKREDYLVCHGMTFNQHTITTVAFTFADNKLAMIDARGGAKTALTKLAKDQQVSHLGFDIHLKERMFFSQNIDSVRIIGADYQQSIIFMWSNPVFSTKQSHPVNPKLAISTPQVLQFGKTLQNLRPLFEDNCQGVMVKNIEKIWLESKPAKQTQLNCYGIPYAGFIRKAEAVFGDDKLQLVWILTQKPEESRLRALLTERFGQADYIDENWEAFDDWKVALRKDKPEVLILSDQMARIYRNKHQ